MRFSMKPYGSKLVHYVQNLNFDFFSQMMTHVWIFFSTHFRHLKKYCFIDYVSIIYELYYKISFNINRPQLT